MVTFFTYMSRFLLPVIFFVVCRLFSFPPANVYPLAFIMFIPLMLQYKKEELRWFEPLLQGFLAGALIALQLQSQSFADPYQESKVYYITLIFYGFQYSVIFFSFYCINKYFKKWSFILIPCGLIVLELLAFAIPYVFIPHLSLSLSGSTYLLKKIMFIGILGLDAVIILSNDLLTSLIVLIIEKKDFKSYIIPVSLLSCITVFLLLPLNKKSENMVDENILKVGYIQASIPTWQYGYIQYSKNMKDEIASEYIKYLDSLKGLDCIIFPENIFIGSSDEVMNQISIIQSWAKENSAFCIVNADYKEGEELSNAALLIDQSGNIDNIYKKINLIYQFESDFYTKGNEVTIFDIKDKKAGILICYDIMFPKMYRELNEKGAQFYITIASATFAGLSNVPYLHFAYSRMYALQEQKPIIHVSQTGCSGIAMPDGSVVAYMEPFEKGFQRIDVSIP